MSKPKFESLVLWLDLGSRLLLAAVFLVAAVPKIADPLQFAEVIDAYGILPEMLILPVAVVLPLAEILVALALVGGRREGFWGSVVMLLIFIAVLGYGVWIGLDIDCGCFGPGDPEHEAFSGLRVALIRDLLLCIPLCYCWWYCYVYKRLNKIQERK